jgi:hypothetical protein
MVFSCKSFFLCIGAHFDLTESIGFVAGSLVNRKGMSRGEQEAVIRHIIAKSWDIPGSPRSSIARSTVLRWVSLYEASGGTDRSP